MGNEASSQSHARSSFGGLDYTSASGLTNFANTASFAVDKEAMLSFDERGAGLEMEEHLGAGTVTTDHHRAHTDTEGPSVHVEREGSVDVAGGSDSELQKRNVRTDCLDEDELQEQQDDRRFEQVESQHEKRFVWKPIPAPTSFNSGAALGDGKAPPSQALNRKISRLTDLKNKKQVAEIQRQEQQRALAMQRHAIERELSGPGYGQTHKESHQVRRVKAAVAEAKKASYNVFEYTTFSSRAFDGFDETVRRQ